MERIGLMSTKTSLAKSGLKINAVHVWWRISESDHLCEQSCTGNITGKERYLQIAQHMKMLEEINTGT